MKPDKPIKAARLLIAMCLAMCVVSCGKSQSPAPGDPPASTGAPGDASLPVTATESATSAEPVTGSPPVDTDAPSDMGKPVDTGAPVDERGLEASTPPVVTVGPIAISEPGFEADGSWRLGQSGVGVDGLFGKSHQDYINAGFIDLLPGRGIVFAYNNGQQHDLFQVLTATVAANTTYTLSIVAIHPTFADPFPGGELRLGYVSETLTPKRDYGLNLMTPASVDAPQPVNGPEVDDGYETWTYTFVTGPSPLGLGRPLRIEVLGGGGAQSLFDNVRLEARAAPPAESNRAFRPASEGNEVAPVVVMFGDSTTDRGMPKFVKDQLDRLITAGVQRPTVINAGKGFDNATSALERLEKDVLAHNPDIVTVSFGLNDTGGRKPDQFKESLQQIVKALQDADIQVVLMTSTPFNNDRHGWGTQFQDLGGLDEYMDREFCEKTRSLADGKEVLLCDLHTIFTEAFKQDGDLINKVISGDGVHLTDEGYLLVAEHTAPIIHALLRDESTDPAK
jgi:lysophospholipase L1-like esterase